MSLSPAKMSSYVEVIPMHPCSIQYAQELVELGYLKAIRLPDGNVIYVATATGKAYLEEVRLRRRIVGTIMPQLQRASNQLKKNFRRQIKQ